MMRQLLCIAIELALTQTLALALALVALVLVEIAPASALTLAIARALELLRRLSYCMNRIGTDRKTHLLEDQWFRIIFRLCGPVWYTAVANT